MKVKYFIGTPDYITTEVNKFLSREDIEFKSASSHGDGLRLMVLVFYEVVKQVEQPSLQGKPTVISTGAEDELSTEKS